jgi:hypothetical protein
MTTLTETVEIKAAPEKVFGFVDDIQHTGWHMKKSSMAMMGSKLTLEVLSKNKTGLGATYRWYGQVMGMAMDFSEEVTEWVKNKRRVWETTGKPKLIIMNGYKMWFEVEPVKNKTRITFGITYDLPRDLRGKILGAISAKWYSKWCLKSMTQDAKTALEQDSMK